MRIVHTGDWHLTEGHRFDGTLKCLEYIADARDIDLWLIGGDLSGTTVPHIQTPKERNALADIFIRMAQRAPVVVIYGNHDHREDLRIFSHLKTRFPILVIDTPCEFSIAGIRLQAVPYMRGFTDLADLLQPHRGIRREPTVLLAHLAVAGARLAGGEVLRPREMAVSATDLKSARFIYAALSHIHTHQEVAETIVYAGSPDRSNFAETDPKGFVIADLNPQTGHVARIAHVLTPACRLVTVDAKIDSEGRLATTPELKADDLASCEVKIRLEYDESLAHLVGPAEQKIRDLCSIADRVVIEHMVNVHAAPRMPAIAAASTVAEKVSMYLSTLSPPVDDATRAGVLRRLEEVEDEASRNDG